MKDNQWQKMFGWSEKEVSDLRFAAYSYIKEGIYDIALSFFDALSTLTAPTAYDLQTIGALHLQMGDSLKALSHLERALAIAPEHLPTQLNRAKALFSLGYKKQAIAEMQRLIQAPNEEIVRQASALLLAYL